MSSAALLLLHSTKKMLISYDPQNKTCRKSLPAPFHSWACLSGLLWARVPIRTSNIAFKTLEDLIKMNIRGKRFLLPESSRASSLESRTGRDKRGCKHPVKSRQQEASRRMLGKRPQSSFLAPVVWILRLAPPYAVISNYMYYPMTSCHPSKKIKNWLCRLKGNHFALM